MIRIPFIKPKYSDIEYIKGIQSKDQVIMRSFYNHCWKYYLKNYNAVIAQSVFCNPEIREPVLKKEDLFQETFIILWTNIENGKIFLRDDVIYKRDESVVNLFKSSLTTYFFGIVKNKYKEQTRKEQPCLMNDLDVGDETEPDQSVEELKIQIVSDCVQSLPQRCKEILTMFYYQKMNLEAILERRKENVSKGGLKVSKSKCMTSLKNLINKEFVRFNLKPYTHEG